MRNKSIFALLVSAAVGLAGCNKNAGDTEQVEKIKADTRAAARDMKDYAYAQKAEFVAEMQTHMTALNADLDSLSARIERSSDATKTEARARLQELRDQAARLNKQLEDARGANESTWDDVKAGCRKAYDSMNDSFKQARQWLSDKIAP